jgi:Mrp family chromosome partitioning ATPase
MGEISEALRRARDASDKRPAPALDPIVASTPSSSAVAAPPVRTSEHIDSPPRTREGLWSPRALFVEDHGPAAESARHLALRVRAELERRHSRSVAVISALHDEGKTTVAGNLAIALCSLSQGRSIALVDLDLRRPSLAKALGVTVKIGIDDVVAGDKPLGEACISFDRPLLDAYPVRQSRASAHELLVRATLESTLRELERRYEIVVIDTAPVLLVPDTPILLECMTAAVAVARAGRSRTQAFKRMCEMIPAGKLIGAVLDEGKLPAKAASYRYYEQ